MNSRRFCLRYAALAVCVVILAFSPAASGQQTPIKRPLTHNDYDSWRSIQGQRISRDGKFSFWGRHLFRLPPLAI